jgi:phenylacetate-coenzyme A ligase PaaK-like adenylate-forming protein
MSLSSLKSNIFCIADEEKFKMHALEIFRYQAINNNVYKYFLESMAVKAELVRDLKDIPFLPVSTFKNEKVIANSGTVQKVFQSSRTTGAHPSAHYITDLSLYEQSLLQCFELFYGDPKEYVILALLPSYLERKDSSLVYMVNCLMTSSSQPENKFYLDEEAELFSAIEKLLSQKKKFFLIGVSFALLRFAEKYYFTASGNNIIMETGGMKGREKEIVREELHGLLSRRFNTSSIHSEYGMTEMLSQAYAKSNGKFFSPPWMKVMVREMYDPLSYCKTGISGMVNVIDLANIDSCAFLATDDLGRLNDDGSFEILGRADYSDIRGCNLMVG